MDREIRVTHEPIGYIKFKYVSSKDIFNDDEHECKINIHPLTVYVFQKNVGGNFFTGIASVALSIDGRDEVILDSGNVALVWGYGSDDRYIKDTVNKEFITDLKDYMFLLEDKFFAGDGEAKEYFRNFVNKCYQAWLKQKKNKLGIE